MMRPDPSWRAQVRATVHGDRSEAAKVVPLPCCARDLLAPNVEKPDTGGVSPSTCRTMALHLPHRRSRAGRRTALTFASHAHGGNGQMVAMHHSDRRSGNRNGSPQKIL